MSKQQARHRSLLARLAAWLRAEDRWALVAYGLGVFFALLLVIRGIA